MKWLKKLFNLMREEEEERISAEKQERTKPSSSFRIETKVTYQYPKGKFRFPLIPDEHMSSPKRVSAVREVAATLINESSEQVRKKPFRPSEVPSPIYGYKQRPKKEPVEFEITSEAAIFPQKDEEIVEIVLEDDKTPLVSNEINRFEEEVEEIRAAALLPTEDTDPLANFDLTKNEEETLANNREQADEKAAAEEVQQAEEAQQIEQNQFREQEQKEKRRSPIPYNVIMLKQDRQKWEERKKQEQSQSYRFPSLTLLNPPVERQENDEQWLNEQRELLNQTFESFNVGAAVVCVTQGPTVTRFEVQPERGVKVNKITSLADDIKLSLAARDIRIEAPIPGKSTIGIEIPNLQSRPVFIREILQSPAFVRNPSPLTVALGLDISGTPIVTDLKKMPHGLIAGATGSGKSVCINAMLVSLLYKAAPHEVKLLLIDPKMVELAPYNHIPHLVSPVITDVKAATGALKWAVEEMERRYELFAHAGVRDINRYNELVKREQKLEHHMPYIVIIIDELADLMMVSPADVEEAICRIAQKARACGIHLIVATQRPSVDVITGLIKANIPTRIAFSVSSQIDSRTIIDTNGAEKLLGRGDMLFLENGTSKTVRVQGNYVSDEEIERVVAHVKSQMAPSYLFQQEDLIKQSSLSHEDDELFLEACEFVVQQGGASTSSLQRRFRIGYNRAARLIEMMEEHGIISEARGSKPRDVLITEEELAKLQETML
ncbi:S-DNA-T family DNA segregation ATPase FtsK/SpoIIIE [Anoxybacillus vitaminiphilus]|uniref:S-DNA-T family DNA segregation ATPase FtsK/SpoIIIE n=1 Tax=Paranoxybacillus vitaminiphilus TaxID=581036 RepID=A0A327YJS2_9BACL|nr:DNA translocase FtsK [Anoxybacillus vitaminiphilus]RAK21203.1 S-DNA-T family DNA segregation ATPase FtsK/SpoIIIE [Anoxybacillus vitaminiphilus]